MDERESGAWLADKLLEVIENAECVYRDEEEEQQELREREQERRRRTLACLLSMAVSCQSVWNEAVRRRGSAQMRRRRSRRKRKREKQRWRE